MASLLVIDMIHRKIINRFGTDATEEGIALNGDNTAIYIRNPSRNKILKLDVLANKVLENISLWHTSIWKRIALSYLSAYENELIAVNPSTNEIYVSDSKRSLLYEIDG